MKNNEKNYTRLFSSNSSRRVIYFNNFKKSSNNTQREKEAFFKQTNATDLKFILKICNKDF